MDALAEIAMNPLGDEKPQAEEVDLDAVVCPDFFDGVRQLLCRDDGSPRRLVRVAPYLCAYALVVGPLAFAYIADDEPLYEMFCVPVKMGSPTIFLWILHPIVKPGGTLDMLGAGERKIAEAELWWLYFWRRALVLPLAAAVGMGLMMGGWWLGQLLPAARLATDSETVFAEAAVKHAEDRVEDGLAPVPFDEREFIVGLVASNLIVPCWVFSMFVGAPAICAWFLSMKVGVSLAEDDVADVLRRTTIATLIDDETWATEVARGQLHDSRPTR